LQKENPLTINLLIELKINQGQLPRASELLASLGKSEQSAPLALLNRARLAVAEHHATGALYQLEAIAESNGVPSHLLLDAGELLTKIGARKIARNTVLKALFIDPENDRAKAMAFNLRPPYLR
jgi:predicted negative regulator of RcsB-dependent stress response